MPKYILKRFLYLIFVLLGVSLIVFTLLYVTPGDPAKIMLGEAATPEALEEVRESLGLNDSYIVRYANYMKGIIVDQDLGTSYVTRRPVLTEIMNVFPNTLSLATVSILIAVVLGVILGIISAVKQYSWIDNFVMIFALIGTSAPIFWIGILMILLFL